MRYKEESFLGWLLLLFIITIVMWVFRIYCINHSENFRLQIVLPIVDIIIFIIAFIIIVPKYLNTSAYHLYIYPDNKYYYLLTILIIYAFATQILDLYKRIKSYLKIKRQNYDKL